MRLIRKNKNGNINYYGIFNHARIKEGKLYVHFSGGVREVPQYGGASYKGTIKMSDDEYYKLKKVKRIKEK